MYVWNAWPLRALSGTLNASWPSLSRMRLMRAFIQVLKRSIEKDATKKQSGRDEMKIESALQRKESTNPLTTSTSHTNTSTHKTIRLSHTHPHSLSSAFTVNYPPPPSYTPPPSHPIPPHPISITSRASSSSVPAVKVLSARTSAFAVPEVSALVDYTTMGTGSRKK